MNSTPPDRPAARLLRAVAACMLAVLALPAAAKSMFYVSDPPFPTGSAYYTTTAWYVVLNGEGKARLTGWMGSQTGVYTDNGSETLVTLGKPLVRTTFSAPDPDCGYEQHAIGVEVRQVLFRRAPGTNAAKGKSQVVEIGQINDPGNACRPAMSTTFGSLGEAGITMLHRSSAKREPMSDLVAGLTIAGFSEVPAAPPEGSYPFFETDVVTLEAPTTLRFHRSGHVLGAALSGDQWLVLDLPGSQRAYTRFSIDAATGAELWFAAEWRDGKPQKVFNTYLFKPMAGASLGTKAQTSRMWESFLAAGTNTPFFFYVYRNDQGDRVSKDVAAGTETRTPFAWTYDGADLFMTRMIGTTLSERRWTPLGRVGKYQWVMEQEQRTLPGQAPYAFIPPRVIGYIDRGAAVPPPP